MRSLSRREFFASWLNQKGRPDSRAGESARGWCPVGSIRNFGPNTTTFLGRQGIAVVSTSEGIAALSFEEFQSTDPAGCRPVKLERNGVMWVNHEEIWPRGSALSLMTEERIQLGQNWEELE